MSRTLGKTFNRYYGALLAMLLLAPTSASAEVAPWDSSVTKAIAWFTGPSALNIGIVAFAIVLITMMFSEGARNSSVFRVVAAVSVLMVLVPTFTGMFTATGAVGF